MTARIYLGLLTAKWILDYERRLAARQKTSRTRLAVPLMPAGILSGFKSLVESFPTSRSNLAE